MFGKRPPAQHSADDFESDDLTQDFTSEAEETTDSMTDDADAWGDGSDSDHAVPQKGEKKSGSALSKILPFAAIGFLGAAGAGYYYVNYMTPRTEANPPSIVATDGAPAITANAETATAPVIQTETTAATTETPAMPTVADGTPSSATEEQTLGSISEPAAAAPVDPQMASAPSNLVAGDPALAAPVDPANMPAADTANIGAAAVEPAPTAPVTDAETMASPTPSLTPATPVSQPVAPASTEVNQPMAVAKETAPDVSAPAMDRTVPAMPAAMTTAVTTQQVTGTGTSGAGVSAPVTADKMADMSQRLDVLEHQINDLTKAIDRLAGANAAPDAGLAAKVSQLQSAVAALQNMPRATETATRATPAPVATRSAPRATSTEAAPRAATAAPAAHNSWVLRAAQDGEAWISASAQGQLRHVKVGETISGLGRITSIQLKNGRWVVSGTQGTVSQ